MNGITIGIYGLYLILVGLNGNAGQLAGKVQDDAPKFLPWVIAIVVLAFVNTSGEAGRKVTGPFIALLILAFVLKRFDTLKDQSQQLWNMAANAKPSSTGNASAASSPTMPTDASGNLTQFSDALYALEHSL